MGWMRECSHIRIMILKSWVSNWLIKESRRESYRVVFQTQIVKHLYWVAIAKLGLFHHLG